MAEITQHRVTGVAIDFAERRSMDDCPDYDRARFTVSGEEALELNFFIKAGNGRNLLRQLADRIDEALAGLEPIPGTTEAMVAGLADQEGAQLQRDADPAVPA